MKKLIQKLNQASNEYYNFGESSLTDLEYDTLLQQLKEMEERTGITYNNSPTLKVGYPVLNILEKVKITDKLMLSLQKTKDEKELLSFKKRNKVLGMIKCDGLSVRIIYNDGILVSAHTRGDGFIGGNITEHIKTFSNVPQKIPYKKPYIIDGEAIIKTNNFYNLIKDNQFNFSNPRNAACGSLNLLDIKEVKKRHLDFIAWDVIKGNLSNSLQLNLLQAQEYGFEIVYFTDNINTTNENIKEKAQELNIPCDGVVWKYDDIKFYTSLGTTSHHDLGAIAFKFYDESYETKLLDIEWGMGRTGRITPIAIFEPVEIDGTIVEKASLHNLNVMEETLGKHPKVGQIVEVAKMNMIIPQIVNSDLSSGEGPELKPPKICPICGNELTETANENIRFLYCINPECQGQLVNRLDHFCGKKGLDIKGLSKATLEKLVGWGWINSLKDIFSLKEHRKEWVNKEGFGVASVDKILLAIENAKQIRLDAFICSLGIPLIGKTISREIVKHINSYEDFRKKINEKFDFSKFEGFAEVKSDNLLNFDYTEADELYLLLSIENPKDLKNASANINVVITGKLKHYKNRAELQSAIEAAGGKVSSSISSKTDYLINNDLESQSSKNKKAKDLNIPIISEEEFISKFLTF